VSRTEPGPAPDEIREAFDTALRDGPPSVAHATSGLDERPARPGRRDCADPRTQQTAYRFREQVEGTVGSYAKRVLRPPVLNRLPTQRIRRNRISR
jgi:hypothetical protein